MTPQTFSLEMCRLLSSLAPGFEGHYYYGKHKDKVEIYCTDEINTWNSDNPTGEEIEKICPAWQGEDVLRNLREITAKIKYKSGDQGDFNLLIFSEYIVTKLIYTSDHYQKIEEYLWSILK